MKAAAALALVLLISAISLRADTPPAVAPPAPPGPGFAIAPHPNMLSPQDWQKLNAARMAALKANPDLMKKAMELSARMRDFQQKLDAAIVKINPTTAPIVARLEHGMPGQHPPLPPQGAPHPPPSALPAATSATAPAPTH